MITQKVRYYTLCICSTEMPYNLGQTFLEPEVGCFRWREELGTYYDVVLITGLYLYGISVLRQFSHSRDMTCRRPGTGFYLDLSYPHISQTHVQSNT